MHGNPGLAFHGFDGFKLLKGLVLEGDATAHVTVTAAPPQPRDGLLAVPVQFTSRNGGNKSTLHATAEILLADTLPTAPSITRRASASSSARAAASSTRVPLTSRRATVRPFCRSRARCRTPSVPAPMVSSSW